MDGLFNVLASSYIVFIVICVILILAIIGYNSVKNDDLVIKNDMRSNRNTPELEDLKKEVEGRSINDTVTSNTMKMNPLGNIPSASASASSGINNDINAGTSSGIGSGINNGVNNEIEKL